MRSINCEKEINILEDACIISKKKKKKIVFGKDALHTKGFLVFDLDDMQDRSDQIDHFLLPPSTTIFNKAAARSKEE